MLKVGTKIYIVDEKIDTDTGLPILKLATIKTILTEYEIVDRDGFTDIIHFKEIKGLPE